MADEKKTFSEAEREDIAERAAQSAMEHFKHGLNCAESVFLGYLEQDCSGFPKEAVALSSGMGFGMGATQHTCGAVNAGLLIIGSRHGRKDPYAKESFEERRDELHHAETGIYPRHGAYIRACVAEWGTTECRDLCLPFDESTPEGAKARKRNCKQIIGWCAREAARAALKD